MGGHGQPTKGEQYMQGAIKKSRPLGEKFPKKKGGRGRLSIFYGKTLTVDSQRQVKGGGPSTAERLSGCRRIIKGRLGEGNSPQSDQLTTVVIVSRAEALAGTVGFDQSTSWRKQERV